MVVRADGRARMSRNGMTVLTFVVGAGPSVTSTFVWRALSNRIRTEPIRISSPSLSSRGPASFFPLTNVPFLLPLSRIANPPVSPGKITA